MAPSRSVDTGPAPVRKLHPLLALVPPLVAFVAQLALQPFFEPSVWFLFYPAVFISCWLGGLRVGVLTALLSAAAVIWFFLPPVHSFVAMPGGYLAAAVFVSTGVFFGIFHDRLRMASAKTAQALAASEGANAELKKALNERRIFAALVENSSDFIGIADPEGRPVYVNPAGRRMVGMAPDAPVEQTKIPDYYPPEQQRFARDVIVKSMIEKGRWQGETYFRNWQTEATIPVSDTHFMITDSETGQVLGMSTITRDITERKRLEEALQASHDDLNRAQSVAKVGSWRLDVRRNELEWSPESYRIFGVAPGTAMTYEAFLACVHPDDRAYVHEKWSAALRGEPYDIEHRIVADGKIKWVREKADLEFDAHQALVGGIGITQDVTERKQLEEELRLAEAKASGIVSISADAIISSDETGRITLFNEGAEAIFGFKRDEVIGSPVDRLLPERLRRRHGEHFRLFAEGQEVSRRMGERGAEIIGRRKNGEEFPADAAISKLEVGGKRVLTVSLRDVSEEKREERDQKLLADIGAVTASTLDFDERSEKVTQIVAQTLADFCIVYLIDGEELRRFKVASRDPAKRWICEWLMQVPMELSRGELVRQATESGKSVLVESISAERLESMATDPEHQRVLRAMEIRSMMICPMRVQGRVVGAFSLQSSRDRAYTPRDLRLGEELAHRAGLALENARLYSMAKQAVRARDDVLGLVAHDLRNPLGTILMQTELLRRFSPEGDRRLRGPAETIERSARRMNRLIKDLLDMTRVEAGGLSVERGRVAVAELVADAVGSQEALASAAAIELRSEVAPLVPDVWADRDRLLQVFENLIGNALKFTEAGGTITVGARLREGEVVFSVTDTGVGIAPENLPHVFDRFWQAAQAKRAGAGLGLAIAKGIVDAHDGHIWVESMPGRGTTFFFAIPAALQLQRPVAHTSTTH